MGAVPSWARGPETGQDALQNGGTAELRWLDEALLGRPSAALWTGPRELVAPLSYERHPSLAAACASSARRGWPVRMRRSGGGVVPQGPGLLNLSVACIMDGEPARLAESVYAGLCALLAAALRDCGIATVVGSVDGSFCDGRFNVAVPDGSGGAPRKIAGTAQYWRRSGAHHAVLAHALLILDADVESINSAVNAFEADAGSGRVHSASTLISAAAAWTEAHGGQPCPSGLRERLEERIARELPRHFPIGAQNGGT